MDHIDHFLKTWNATKNIEAFLDKKIELPNSDMIRIYLEKLPSEEKQEVCIKLQSILEKIEAHAKKIKQGLTEIEEQLAQTQSAKDMCVSYAKAHATNKGANENAEDK